MSLKIRFFFIKKILSISRSTKKGQYIFHLELSLFSYTIQIVYHWLCSIISKKSFDLNCVQTCFTYLKS